MRLVDFLNRIAVFYSNSFRQRQLNVWVFGEWFGKRTGDNVSYFANYMAENYRDIELYWLCDPSCPTSRLHSRIRVVDYTSKEAIDVLKRASVAVMGEGIADLNPNAQNYLGNAIKVNLWHGIMWKKIGNDAEVSRAAGVAGAIRRKLYHYDYFVSPSDAYSEHIKTAFDASDEDLICAGLPRNCIFYDEDRVRQCRSALESRLGTEKPILVSYLPTFRDSGSAPFSFSSLRDPAFEQWLREKNVFILQKAHAAEKGSFGADQGRILTVEDIPAQELMAASDVLITDYSSCFFDYLLLDRPIIHFLYDYDFYKDRDRGLYYEKEEVVCGEAPQTPEELMAAIRRSVEAPMQDQRLRALRREKFLTYEGPDSCKKIADFLVARTNKRGRKSRSI